MTFQFTIELAAPRELVWRAFDNTSNLRKWQPTLVSLEPVCGTAGQVGAVSQLTYRESGREIILVETITVRREPAEFGGSYESDHGVTLLSNRFVETAADRTRWDVETEAQLRGMARFLAPMLRGMIEGRVRTDCQRFKSLLESGELQT